MIDGVDIHPLRQFADPKGKVMHMIRCDSPHFRRFGEIYFSQVNPGAVKAWKRHKEMTQNFAVPVGRIRLVLFDDRPQSPTCGQLEVMEIGEGNYVLVVIPPSLWYGFSGVSSDPAIVANCSDMPHNPQESERIEPNDPSIPYHLKQWKER